LKPPANTHGKDCAEVGLYPVELVMKDRKKPLDAAQMEMVRALLVDASVVAVEVDTET